MTIITAQYWPHGYDPLRYGALVTVLTQERGWYTVRGFDGTTWLAVQEELEPRVETENDSDNDA